jgi:CheY-like chemotaxis protein
MGLLSSPAATACVVIVDDDDSVREVTEMVLAGAGHSVRATASGVEALRWLEERPWDLLILDLRMPEIDGLTLYREVLARWPTAAGHVLFVSGVTEMPHDDHHTVKALNVPVLLKPFTLDDLRAAVVRMLATR